MIANNPIGTLPDRHASYDDAHDDLREFAVAIRELAQAQEALTRTLAEVSDNKAEYTREKVLARHAIEWRMRMAYSSVRSLMWRFQIDMPCDHRSHQKHRTPARKTFASYVVMDH